MIKFKYTKICKIRISLTHCTGIEYVLTEQIPSIKYQKKKKNV